MLLWNSVLISFFQTESENEVSLLVAEATPKNAKHAKLLRPKSLLGDLGGRFLDLWGIPHTWRECRQKNKGVEAGERTFTSLLPDLPKAQRLYHPFVHVLLNKLSLLWLC